MKVKLLRKLKKKFRILYRAPKDYRIYVERYNAIHDVTLTQIYRATTFKEIQAIQHTLIEGELEHYWKPKQTL